MMFDIVTPDAKIENYNDENLFAELEARPFLIGMSYIS